MSTVAPGASWYGARRNCGTLGTEPVADRGCLRSYTAWHCAVPSLPPADAGSDCEPLHKRCIDLPATGSQDLLDRPLRAKHHAVLHRHEAPPAHGFHHLRI